MNAPVDARRLEREIAAAATLKASLIRLTDDTEALRDTIEGATSLHEAVRAVLVAIEDDQAMVDGITARVAELAARKARFAAHIETMRALIEQAMAVGEIKKIEADIATVSLKAVPPKAVVTDESAIPSSYFETLPPKLEMSKLLAALKQGPVEGAELSNGGTTIQIRRS